MRQEKSVSRLLAGIILSAILATALILVQAAGSGLRLAGPPAVGRE